MYLTIILKYVFLKKGFIIIRIGCLSLSLYVLHDQQGFSASHGTKFTKMTNWWGLLILLSLSIDSKPVIFVSYSQSKQREWRDDLLLTSLLCFIEPSGWIWPFIGRCTVDATMTLTLLLLIFNISDHRIFKAQSLEFSPLCHAYE